jgi:ankyrin repeat protein
MNLEQLRKQAKELVKAGRTGDSEALERLGGREPILANAQLALARENGYASWPALVAAVEATVDAFVEAATDGRRDRAERLLAAKPEIRRDPWARLVRGESWDGDPNRPGGPREWAPLLYVTHSVFANTDAARALLARGADPNATFTNEYGEMSALYGHALDYDRIEPVRMLLEAGGDPNEGALAAHAIRRGRGPEFLRLLAEHGADLDRAGGETWRGDVPLRTPYAHAALRNRKDNMDMLAELGASTDVDPADLVVAAVARGEKPAGPLPADLDPDAQEVLILGALDGQLDSVVEAVGPNFSGVVGGSPEGTLLHHAAWVGRVELVRELLKRGADARAVSRAEFSTPLAWVVLASQHYSGGDRDYVGVAEALVEEDAELEPRFLEIAAGPLLDWLQLQLPGEL